MHSMHSLEGGPGTSWEHGVRLAGDFTAHGTGPGHLLAQFPGVPEQASVPLKGMDLIKHT